MKNNMIIVTVPLGFSDKIIKAVNSAGSTGGTIIRSRSPVKPQKEGLFCFNLEREVENILIFAAEEDKELICRTIQEVLRAGSIQQGTIFVLPVQKFLG